MMYSVWVGGVEVGAHLMYKKEAERVAKMWRVWVKALGEKSGASNREADYIAMVRSIIVGLNFITCLFIIAGVIHNW